MAKILLQILNDWHFLYYLSYISHNLLLIQNQSKAIHRVHEYWCPPVPLVVLELASVGPVVERGVGFSNLKIQPVSTFLETVTVCFTWAEFFYTWFKFKFHFGTCRTWYPAQAVPATARRLVPKAPPEYRAPLIYFNKKECADIEMYITNIKCI